MGWWEVQALLRASTPGRTLPEDRKTASQHQVYRTSLTKMTSLFCLVTHPPAAPDWHHPQCSRGWPCPLCSTWHSRWQCRPHLEINIFIKLYHYVKYERKGKTVTKHFAWWSWCSLIVHVDSRTRWDNVFLCFLPMIVMQPFLVTSTTLSIRFFVPLAKFSHSNTPTGPFHTICLALDTASALCLELSGPQSKPCK